MNLTKIKLDNTIVFLVFASLFTEVYSVVLHLGIIDDLLRLVYIMLLIIFFVKKGIRKKQIVVVVYFLLFAYLIVSLIFLFVEPIPFFYELFKLSTFFLFFPYFYISPDSAFRTDYKLLNILRIFFIINTIIIILQYILGPEILSVVGVPREYFYSSMRKNRWAGLMLGPTILGPVSLLFLLLNEFHKEKKEYKVNFFISSFNVILSTSKGSMMGLIIVVIFLKMKKKIFFIFFIAILLASLIFYNINSTAINSKMNQYSLLFSAVINSSALESNKVEHRARSIFDGIQIFLKRWPDGTGLGTWGDASSKYLKGDYGFTRNTFSDSFLIHIFVEQGAIIFFLFFIYLLPISISNSNRRIKFAFIFIVLLLGGYTILSTISFFISFIYARLISQPPKFAHVEVD